MVAIVPEMRVDPTCQLTETESLIERLKQFERSAAVERLERVFVPGDCD